MKYIVETKGVIGNYNNDIKYKTEKDMTSEKSKELTCPKCGAVLDDKTYGEYTVYHNCIVGWCKKCGYNAPIHIFFKNQ